MSGEFEYWLLGGGSTVAVGLCGAIQDSDPHPIQEDLRFVLYKSTNQVILPFNIIIFSSSDTKVLVQWSFFTRSATAQLDVVQFVLQT